MPIKAYFTMLLSKTQQDFTLKIERLEAMYISYSYLSQSKIELAHHALIALLEQARLKTYLNGTLVRDTWVFPTYSATSTR